MKKATLCISTLIIFLVSCTTSTETGEYDTRAVEGLDKLTETVGLLNSCSYTLNTIIVKSDKEEIANQHDVYFKGADKMYVHTLGTKGEKEYWYNEGRLAFYSYTKNIYDTVSAPLKTLEAITFLHDKYGIDFPAADFFYPTLTDDIITNYNKVLFAEEQEVENVKYIVVEAVNDTRIMQIWIDKITNLPYKMIIEPNNSEDEYYEATFSNWRIDPNLPDLMFQFTPLTGSVREQL